MAGFWIIVGFILVGVIAGYVIAFREARAAREREAWDRKVDQMPVKTISVKRSCSVCHGEMKAIAKFCPKCGAKVMKLPPAIEPGSVLYCNSDWTYTTTTTTTQSEEK